MVPLHVRITTKVQLITAKKPSRDVALTISATFSSCDHELITLIFKYDQDSVMMSQHAKYIGQRSFCSKVTIWAHRQAN